MPQNPPKASSDREAVRLIWLAAFISVFSFLYYERHGDILLSGDAVAHINIARRVFDSKTPGLLQLGTVWLPLPHLLILPFIVPIRLWQTGSGASIPSMVGCILGVFGIFRFLRIVLSGDGPSGSRASTAPAWAAALLYASNPNLIYMQATAMNESLYLAFFIWALVFFAEFVREGPQSGSLTRCGLCIAAACLTRYDGWFLGAVLVVLAIVVTLGIGRSASGGFPKESVDWGKKLVKFVFVACAAPALWIAYNAAVYRNPLEFENGPYSARAIERKTGTINPANGNLYAAASYFLKATELNVGAENWQGRLWIGLAAVGAIGCAFTRGRRIALLLLIPLPFYALSIAYGGIPIFVPNWWPFSVYNVRYGLELLPAVSILVPLAVVFAIESGARISRPGMVPKWQAAAIFGVVIVLAFVNYSSIWRLQPICFREALMNNRGRIALENQLAKWIESSPPDSTFLMYMGQHSGAFEEAGVPLRRVINEGNHRVWKEPYDSGGLWERALADPSAYANVIIGFQGGPVWNAAEQHHLVSLVEIHASGQAPAAIFAGSDPRPGAERPR